MLKTLTIRNYALITNLEIDFPPNFSVITGETGAGKSIILGALSLILGQRADAASIKQGENKCVIEGVFDISGYTLQSFFRTNDLEYDPHYCMIRREMWNTGKSRAFINDTPVGLSELKELGSFLIDIHSQHQNLLLKDNRFQLNVLDILADNHPVLEQYAAAFNHYIATEKQLKSLQNKVKNDSDEEEYLRFQLNQLRDAKLSAGEQEELEKELNTLSHIEEIKSALYSIDANLSDDNTGAVVTLKNALNTAQSLTRIYEKAADLAERIESAYIDLKDIASEVSAEQEKLELDPERLTIVSERLDLIYSLQKKHKRGSVEELIGLQNQLEEQLSAIENYEDELKRLQKNLNDASTAVDKAGTDLTHSRKQAAKLLKKELVAKVSVLGMPNMQFDTLFYKKDHPDSTGMDDVEFLFAAAKGVEPQPVARIASGGEISRLMLGIKALIAGAKALPTVIFDEIDTGISGETADKMGTIMNEMGNRMQVIAITHLPQIAVKGGAHYFVYKEEKTDFTETQLRRLTDDERINEIALLLSGSELTPAAIENAKELLKQK
jgi:DNA repair protein RecN